MERFAFCIKFGRLACDRKRKNARSNGFVRVARFRFTRAAGFDGFFCVRTARVLRITRFARIAGFDITTDGPLNATIDYIGSVIDEICRLTEEIDGIKL